MKYLKKFNQHLNYSKYLTSSSYNLIINEYKDNIVSYCVQENEVHYDKYIPPSINGHEYVEIGGIKWATMNIGANSVTDYGLYFQWGDTQGYTDSQVGSGEGQKYFGWADYKYGNGTSSPSASSLTKYNSSYGKRVLDASDDAAQANWGGSWRMPTLDDYAALVDATNKEWTTDYQGSGVEGMICTDKTDSSKILFFPVHGYCYNGSIYNVGNLGYYTDYYWASTLRGSDVRYAYRLAVNSNYISSQDTSFRYYGLHVRGVAD